MLPSDATVGAAMGHPARGGSSSRKQRSKRSKPAGRGSVKSVSKRSTKVARRRGFSGAEAKEEPARLAKELSEALQQQAATADVLRVISRSTFDLQAVLDALTESAARLCKADMATITRKGEGADFYHVTNYNFPPDWVEYARKHPFKPGRGSVHGRSLIKKRAVQVVDVLADPEWTRGEQQRRAGFRTVLAVPLQRDGEPIGVFILCRKTVSPFLEKQIELMSGFADQAVIAIENTRLFNETQEALERQTATADILKVIASSPSDVQPVFEAIAESARLVVGGHSCGVTRVVGDNLHLAAFTTGSEAGRDTLARSFPIPLSSPRTLARVARTGRVVMLADMERDGDDTSKEIARARGYRSMLVVPMLRDSAAIGTIAVTRQEPGGFDDNAIGLLKTFADQAVIAIENARLFNETQEALERQTATADILKVIASSPSDVRPVFDAIVANADRLIGGFSTGVYRFVGGICHLEAFTPVNPAADEMLKSRFPRPVAGIRHFELSQAGETVEITDTETQSGDLPLREIARARGFRSLLYSPLMSKGTAIGVIVVSRRTPGSFSAHHVQLLRTFADQAVIAIENTRLFNETQEALERQTATADILKVIASSPTNLQPVFNAIAERSNRLIRGHATVVIRFAGDIAELAAFTSVSPEADAAIQAAFPAAVAGQLEQVRNGEVREVADTESETLTGHYFQNLARARGFRSRILVPLKGEKGTIGAIGVTRKEPGGFAETDVELLKTFADQAVIAISNVELFQQVQNRTKELSEALQFQTAASDVLKVISRSPDKLQPVLDAIVETSRELCGSEASTILLLHDGKLYFEAIAGTVPKHLDDLRTNPRPIDEPGSLYWRLFREKRTLHFANVMDEVPELSQSWVRLGGPRALLVTPLLNKGEVIGAIVLRQSHLKPFTERQIQAIEVFADQAVIAISNVGLFEQVEARTRDLQESLEQQTATAEILSSISGSMNDTKPVFDAIAKSLRRLFDAPFAMVQTLNDDMVEMAAADGEPGVERRLRQRYPRALSGESVGGIAMLEKRTVQFYPLVGNPAVPLVTQQNAREFNFNSLLFNPMLSGDKVVGAIGVGRREAIPFDDKQIGLIASFANQAVIAIENTRLLRELRERTNDLTEALVYQTGSSNILKVIASSPTDVGPALTAIVESACEICDAYDALVFLKDEGDLVFAAHHGPIPIELERWPINRKWVAGRALVDKAPQHIHDIYGPEGDDFPEGRELARHQGQRTVLSVPLLREGEAIGVISLRRVEVQPFNDKQIALLQSFADQAVIAISNVRLFEQVQERTRELSRSLDDLRTAQDRLIQTEKLASLGQLTAGIAHEIKNPLNFVNNFSALSVELTDELNDVLKQATLVDKIRAEVDELTGLLKDNLDKVVQHGKRADSIVKNMLLHSRQGSGERRSVDVNALVGESLNLAYHGARAEKAGFIITLKHDLDPEAGILDLYPQEMTRALLNLISNGFYAATKRKVEGGDVTFEPVLSAATRNIGKTVEIRIRDNGTGIPTEVREKMFNPFFTTKPTGEGTGLGLSMTHDIVVKQHGGRIDVETKLGEFTEFIITLPRDNRAAAGKEPE